MSPSAPYSELLEPVKAVAHAAGDAIMKVYQGHYCVEQKSDDSPVTEADYAAHNVIAERLAALTPDWPVLSEEGEAVAFERRRQWRRYWLVDPLDGTREFIKCNGEFTVNIALIEDHRPVLGVIQVPVSRECYFAAAGDGAWFQPDGQAAYAIRARQWDGGNITIAGSRSHRSPIFCSFLEFFDDYRVLSLGSSLKSCYVAQGRADIYARFGPTSEWDTAAAQCVVEAAGGRLTDLALRPLRYNTKDSLINPPFFAFGDRRHDWCRYVPKGR
ncbi:3'(2'),5'-bisphosphate nucleotidase CysQ [Candidatus Tenderia electrophaga]|jgi:3'(2'), 5'-bisphosphate nucleotidase|uniref:3'(2'),5'-bisphosphate nucleotidase CysQ n=1 Tax=Candidatus Tenderia electrophaga TaxID=1748243 RepID=A0A0S2TAS3_9GAMM|nr:3'(2'),5'-bisphosphate nucleotidase CysQ [Candidatus Tenderia electrophaga]